MKQHKHRAIETHGPYGYRACVNPDKCNPLSHGGVLLVRLCSCGMKRYENSTGGSKRTERSGWVAPGTIVA